MRDTFPCYYPPTPEEYQKLWKNGTIVVDTNVLLNLYRLPATARDDLFKVLESLTDRLWIPHHVALEFQKRRLSVIANERKNIESALTSAKSLVGDLQKKVDALQLDKRDLGIDPKTLLSELQNANDDLVKAIEKAHQSQLDVSHLDPIRDRIDILFKSKIGPRPASQNEMDALIYDGDQRYSDLIPPGFADINKEKNPKEAIYIYDNIKIERKYGDLIIWRQIINQIKSENWKTLIFITSDRKEDWWSEEHGKTISPHPELINEIKREAGLDLFWMYTSDEFLTHAAKYIAATFSSNSVQEIKNISNTKPITNPAWRIIGRNPGFIDSVNFDISSVNTNYFDYDKTRIEHAVKGWLEELEDGFVDRSNRGFPDFIVTKESYLHGYEVKFIKNFNNMLVSPTVVNALLRGYLESNTGALHAFTLIIVISKADYDNIMTSCRSEELSIKLNRLLGKYPVHSIIIGAVDSDIFMPILSVDGNTYESDSI